ncbi:hypothetical protein HK096_011570, partial [Nowakowskiella sp. JEL0078]
NRALLIINTGFVREWGEIFRYGHTILVSAYGAVYFVLNIISFVNSSLIGNSWYNPFRIVFFTIICVANMSCDIMTFKQDISESSVFVYLIPCGLLSFYIVEKILLQFGYVSSPGSSIAIDEYNN